MENNTNNTNKSKKKKNIIITIGIGVAIFIIANVLYLQINLAQNDYVGAEGAFYNIVDNTKASKQELLDLQKDMVKIDKDKSETIKIDKVIADVEKINYRDASKFNEYVKQLDVLNKEIDNMIAIYNEDQNMKNDMTITNNMMSIEGLNNLIDNIMTEYNNIYSKNFNEAIKKFPVNMVVKSKGWYELDKFTSVK